MPKENGLEAAFLGDIARNQFSYLLFWPRQGVHCTAIGNLGHCLNQDCATMAIYLKGAIRWQSGEDSHPNLRLKL